MKIQMSGVDAEFAKLAKLQKETISRELIKESKEMVSELKAVTPIDTGRAREGWEVEIGKDKVDIVNNVPYINALNNGHSKQEPAFFVERVALNHGKPLGTIVKNIE